VRGFATNGFGPRDLTPGTAQDNLGGNAYWAASYELQSPLPFVPQTFGLKAAVFADAGSLWSTGAGGAGPALSSTLVGNSTAVRSSVGAGLVWDSILGPLRVDYAYPLTKADYDVTQRVHFGYGLF
jgi:outer membrane protein insertion porin family